MERDDFLKDDFLKELLGKQPLDSPSDDFTEKVMASVRLNQEFSLARKPYYLYLKASWPYVLIALTVIIYLVSSDLPYSKFIPGKDYFETIFIPYLKNLSMGFISLFSFIKSATLPLAILASGLLLFMLDHFFFRRHSIYHYFTS
jgi:hypothetical protein